jgi:hypothetical protein
MEEFAAGRDFSSRRRVIESRRCKLHRAPSELHFAGMRFARSDGKATTGVADRSGDRHEDCNPPR